ncbi:type II toxin-antitoxin system RelE/ParE family toxin [Marinivivus vitaminiproducens]|uniref:type II toxin-antitoxin system RelE/ParE family toxin n=1 Tax=Marinivivus vitaminiproducens TaxID=3035935 RepID=UPI00279A8996|nr:type II toxin-antitoxin system RelE/ParE family toxin [Geminicoccaceae bacterium SCSIO 64248]
MDVFWTPEAERDRLAVWEHIFTDNPKAAVAMDELFDDAVLRLAEYPNLGTVGRASGTRELLPHESYRIIYEIRDNAIRILAVVHTARLWPKG